MAVKYLALPVAISRDREQVSDQWHVVLLELQRRGVSFNVNEGHRTMARQEQLGEQLGWYPNGKAGYGTGAARPSNTAPHIRTGREDHAIDVDNAQGVMRGLSALGIRSSLAVPGESWHVEANAADLARVAAKLTGRNKQIAALKARIKKATALRHRAYVHKNWKWWRTYKARVAALQKKLKGLR